MNASIDRELLRINLLSTAQNSHGLGITLVIAKMYARNGGFRNVTDEEIFSEMGYLADKGLITSVEKVISPENKAWRITAAGTDFLAMEGLL